MVAKIAIGKPYKGIENHVLFDTYVFGEGKLAVAFTIDGEIVERGHIDVSKRKYGAYFFHAHKSGKMNMIAGPFDPKTGQPNYIYKGTEQYVEV